jgi:hypothetical protein
MRIRYSVLASLTLGCILAQENSAPQEAPLAVPKVDYFRLPQFRPLRPFVTQEGLAPQEAPLAKPKLDFKFPLFGSPRRSLTKNRLVRPNVKVVPDRQNLLSENPPPCSIPLLQAQIPKDIQFTIRQFRPLPDQLGPMPTVKAPAPACDAKK